MLGGWQSEQGGKKLANFDGHFEQGKKVTGRGQFENILTTSSLHKNETGWQTLFIIWNQILFSNIIQPIQDVARKQNLFIAIQLELNTLERNCWQWKLTKEVSATKRNVLSCKSGYSADHPAVNRKYSGAGANCETDALLVTMKCALCSLWSRAAHYNEHKAW